MAVEVFTSNGTFTRPEGETQALVYLWGAGGAGRAGGAFRGGPGGGGGGYHLAVVTLVDATASVTVGQGGSGDGGQSSFEQSDRSVWAGGGVAGESAPADEQAAGGVGGSFGFDGEASISLGYDGGTGGTVLQDFQGGGGGGGAARKLGNGFGGTWAGASSGGQGAKGNIYDAGHGDGGDGGDPGLPGGAGAFHGGGGGGGGLGEAAGQGGDGLVVVVCPPPAEGTRASSGCCCPCPSKEELGLPDVINLLLHPSSGGSAGMPENSVVGACNGNDVRITWSQNSFLLSELSTIVFDYQEEAISGPCGGCCFLYTGRVNFTSPCLSEEGILVGVFPELPFDTRTIGSSVVHIRHSGSGKDSECYALTYEGSPSQCTPGLTPGTELCCGTVVLVEGGFIVNCTSVQCSSVCARVTTWTDATVYIPRAIYATAELVICGFGNTFSVCLYLTFHHECYTSAGGSGEWTSSRKSGDCVDGQCSDVPEQLTGDLGVESCAKTTSSLALRADVDLTEISGDTVWDKLKNATLEDDYEISLCNCPQAYGCADDYFHGTYDCDSDSNCQCFPGPGEPVEIDTADHPVDLDCIYDEGTIQMELAG